MNREENEDPAADTIPDGQERMATQSERDDVNDQIASAEPAPAEKGNRPLAPQSPLLPRPSKFTTCNGEKHSDDK